MNLEKNIKSIFFIANDEKISPINYTTDWTAVPFPCQQNYSLVINRWVQHMAELLWRDGYK